MRLARKAVLSGDGILPAMNAKGLTPILNVSDLAASLRGLKSGAGRNVGIGGLLQLSAPWAPANARFFYATERKGGAAEVQTPPLSKRTETKRGIKASGCQYGWET